jgi:hypothetical protein
MDISYIKEDVVEIRGTIDVLGSWADKAEHIVGVPLGSGK